MTAPPTSTRSHASTLLYPLLWGLSDLRSVLVAAGWWPTRSITAIDSLGACWLVKGEHTQVGGPHTKPRAVVLNGDDCLWGNFQLPQINPHDLDTAISESLWQKSPLPLTDVLSAWRVEPLRDGGWQVTWALATRHRRAEVIRQASLPDSAPTFLMRAGLALPVRTDTHIQWKKQQRWFDWMGAAALAVGFAVAAALALMPAAIERQALIEALGQLNGLEPKAAPVRQQLESLRTQIQAIEAVRAAAAASVPSASILDALSNALPDDTSLDRLDVNGSVIRIGGLTPNATNLLSRLAQNPAFTDAKALTAAVRDPASNKERFSFELTWKSRGGA